MNTVLSVKNLTKCYDSFKLDNASFDIEKGEIAGFIGRNGAGKTTTIKAILNLIHKDGGEIYYFGMPFSENENDIKKKLTNYKYVYCTIDQEKQFALISTGLCDDLAEFKSAYYMFANDTVNIVKKVRDKYNLGTVLIDVTFFNWSCVISLIFLSLK